MYGCNNNNMMGSQNNCNMPKVECYEEKYCQMEPVWYKKTCTCKTEKMIGYNCNNC